MTTTLDLETRILNELRCTENRTKTLRPQDFNASAHVFGMILDLMVKRRKICSPSVAITENYFKDNVKNVDTEIEITMFPGLDEDESVIT